MKQIYILLCILLISCAIPVQDCNTLDGIEKSKCDLNKAHTENPKGIASIIRLQSTIGDYYKENPSLEGIIDEIINTNNAPEYRIYLSKIMRNQRKQGTSTIQDITEHDDKLLDVINNKKDEPSVRGEVLDSLANIYLSVSFPNEDIFISAEKMTKEDEASKYAINSLTGIMYNLNPDRTTIILCDNINKLHEEVQAHLEC